MGHCALIKYPVSWKRGKVAV